MHRRIVTTLGVFATLALVATCGSQVSDPSADPEAPQELELRLELAADLEPFDDCDELLDYFQATAEQMGAAVGGIPAVGAVDAIAGSAESAIAGDGAAAGDAAQSPAEPRLAESTGGPGADDFSGTNIQEVGVDEPDLVKTDGRRIVAVAGGRLHVVDVTGGGARGAGSLALPEGSHELFLDGDRAIVVTRSWQVVALPEPVEPGDSVEPVEPDQLIEREAAASTLIAPGTSTTVVSAVDLSDPDDPRVVDDATFEGDYVTARFHDGAIRIVLRSSPPFLPTEGFSDTGVDDWLPARIATSESTGEPVTEPLVACDAVARPPEPSGVGTVTVLTIDPAAAMEPLDVDTVVADAQTVYASTTTLYVATNAWLASADETATAATTTELHAFDIADPLRTDYLASGRVRGQLLSQWSLSEHEGHLRVATTDGSPWAPPGAEPSSESFLTVLSRDGDRLTRVGQVGNLGRGETIHAVRYVGDLGFVVTFRQVDPLYALDLSDPTNPRVLSELKITGFSAYLHPVSDDLLLGVGQEATEEGRTIGTQVSLFDVSIPTDLRRLDQEVVPDSTSSVEHDHRAFLWWPATRTAVIPIETWNRPLVEEFRAAAGVEDDAPGDVPGDVPGDAPDAALDVAPETFQGALVLEVGGTAVEVSGRITHGGHSPFAPIQRALVVGDTLYTVSEAGVMANDLGTLAEEGWAAF